VREIFFDWLRQHRPDLVPRYQELYRNGAYIQGTERDRLAKLARRGKGLGGARPVRGPADTAQGAPAPVSSPPERQPSLF
jgi:hypothetical protein